MAHIIPSDLTRMALAGAHGPEVATLKTLRAALPEDYTVFHGVHWTREYEGWTHFGEIDFVVLNRSGEVLLIEQKNGALDEVNGSLVKHYEEKAKDPVAQIHRSLDKVREKFQWQHGRQQRLSADYLVYLPDYRVRRVNAAGIDPSRIVDATGDLGVAVRQLLGPGVDRRDGTYKRVHGFFCQTFQVVPDIHAHLDVQEQAFVRQVGPVASVLANLEMIPYGLRFTGTAGSGKSLVARHFLARAGTDGRRVLLTCFNRPLAERLRPRAAAGGMVDTFHGFCVEFLKSQGQTVDFTRSAEDPEFWRRIPDLVTAARIPEDWRFDTLVVDEGQDFEPDWLEVLRLFLTEGADILFMEDPDQNLRRTPQVETPGFVTYRCPVNYRSPETIARFIQDTLPFRFEIGNALPGLGVRVHLGLEVPYRYGSEIRTYIPDFIVLVDDGHGEDGPLDLVVEIKGYRGEDAKDKRATRETYWVPGVNHHGSFGRWAFADVWEMQSDFEARVASEFDKMITGVLAGAGKQAITEGA